MWISITIRTFVPLRRQCRNVVSCCRCVQCQRIIVIVKRYRLCSLLIVGVEVAICAVVIAISKNLLTRLWISIIIQYLVIGYRSHVVAIFGIAHNIHHISKSNGWFCGCLSVQCQPPITICHNGIHACSRPYLIILISISCQNGIFSLGLIISTPLITRSLHHFGLIKVGTFYQMCIICCIYVMIGFLKGIKIVVAWQHIYTYCH